MTVEHVELLVEEPSMEAALRVLLPKVIGEISHHVYSYQCKDDLLKRLPERLRGYASWLPESWRIVVILDRDDDDCRGSILKTNPSDRTVNSQSKKAVQYQLVPGVLEDFSCAIAWRIGGGMALRPALRVGSTRTFGPHS